MTARISGHTRVAAVIGHPVQHTASPRMHNAAFAELGIDAVYVAYDVLPGDLAAAVAGARAHRLLGVNVTLPHKQDVPALCDSLAPSASKIGVVNCLQLTPEGEVVGHNTDAPAVVDSIVAELGPLRPGAQVVILGGGGAARASVSALTEAGAGNIRVIARRPDAVSWCTATPWVEEAVRDAFVTADLVVDCTSIALSAEAEQAIAALPLDALPGPAAVMSLVYHRPPALLEAAKARGHRVIDGAGMLVYQAARSFEIWTGQPAPLSVMWHALRNKG